MFYCFIEILHTTTHYGVLFSTTICHHLASTAAKIEIPEIFDIQFLFFFFNLGSAFLFTNYVFSSFVMYYTVILYLKSSNFLIFGNKQNHSNSEEPKKKKSIGIAYFESKPFRSESVTCL